MGERYLWADSLCIVQNMNDKHEHMVMMEALYCGAVLTLVAAAGSHADHGIPGFSAPFNPAPKVRDIRGFWLTTMRPSFEHSIDSSVWNTRARTYRTAS
ncbi:hypothetical protein HD806DRAFT_527274 [Xylariaceae sp. AK1471]|nr:hypothetical protein HD806DRAFT_527274 [Xylariaceae sp. AK1471]